MAPEMEPPTQEQEIALAEFTDKPWNGSASRFGSTEAYCAASLIDENPPRQEKKQSLCHLPVKEPGGAINKNALRNAAARLSQVQASSEAKAKARNRLRSLLNQAGVRTSLEEQGGMILIPENKEASHGTVLSEIYERIKGVLWPEDEPVEEVQAELEEESEEAEAEEEVAAHFVYQLPYEDTEVELTREGLYKKVIMFADRVVHHSLGEAGVLDHSKDALKKMVAAFKEKAFDQVPLLTHHPGPEDKGKEIFAYLGELVDLDLEDNKLVGFFKLTKRGEEVVKENPNLPTSPGYIPDYERRSDKKRFGPTLQHVATVFKPHLTGLGGWELVHLSAETEVVDLTEATNLTNEPRKEADPVSEVVVEPQEQKEEEVANKSMELSLEEMKRALELAQEEARDAKKSAGMTAQALAEQKVDRYLDKMKREEGVPPFVAELARPLLLEAEVSPEEPSYDVVQLSDEGASKKPLSRGAIVRQLVESYKGTISLEEEGRADVEPDESDEAAQDRRILQLADEQFGGDRRKAAAELMHRGEVTI